MDISILMVAIFTSIACSIVGGFLVLKKKSMVIDAISHTVLLGIVITYLVVKDLNSPLLIIGATLIGVLTVYLIELLVKSKRVSEDATTGVVFPLLFSIAIIIISLEFKNVHLDVDAVLLGKIEYVIFDQLVINGVKVGPKVLYIIGLVMVFNFIFMLLFYKELKVTSFDNGLSYSIGILPGIINLLLMTLVSLTAVAAFDAVGSILVIALMIGPVISALLFTKRLSTTLIYSVIIGIFNSLIGYFAALLLDCSTAASIAFVTLITFILLMIFVPKKGMVYNLIKRFNLKNEFMMIAFCCHVLNHKESSERKLVVNDIYESFSRSKKDINLVIKKALEEKYINMNEDSIILTTKGIEFVHLKKEKYHLVK